MPAGVGYRANRLARLARKFARRREKTGVGGSWLEFYRRQLGAPGTVAGFPMRRAIFDPLGARTTRRVRTHGGVVRAMRRVYR